ncbi:outer membrane protein transport protein [bacterium]|nr:outer membrane protein transport protein [bacterium]
MRLLIPILSTFLIPISIFTQTLANSDVADFIPSSDRHLAMSIRSAGMGGAGVASSEDYTALFYNPANLAYIYRFEMAGALQYDALSFESALDSSASGTGSDSYVKLQNIGGVIPLPTKRGGVSFALGFTRTNSFDRRIRANSTGDDGLIYQIDESVKGGLGKFSLGGGIQISPMMSIGASIDLYLGGERYSWFNDIQNPGETAWPDSVERKIYADDITDEYSGIGARFGMTLVPTRFVQIGAYISTPTSLIIEEDGISRFDSITTGLETYQEDYDIVQSFEVILPWRFGAGLAIRPTEWILLAGDAEYVDWRQIEYDEPAWILSQNRLMDDSYRATLRWSAGSEFTIPIASLKLRGGFSQEPIAYLENGKDRTRNTITGGLGYLVSDLVSLDLATQFSNWNIDETRLDGDYSLTSVWLGLSYRF